MKTPHKHAELIKAWADGAEIQTKIGGIWKEVNYPVWSNDEYRIKPETVKYRRALVLGSSPYVLAINFGANMDYYKHVKWIDPDWIEVEV